MRTLSATGIATLASAKVPMAILVEMDLSTPLFLNTTNVNLVIGGSTYYGTKGLGKISAIDETPAQTKQLAFEISGVASDNISLALSEPVQGKAVRIKTALFDPVTFAVTDTDLRWAGYLDVMTIQDGATSATISVSAEHAGIDLTRPSQSLYTDDEQQRLYPGDLFLQFLNDQVEQRIIWPASSFFRK